MYDLLGFCLALALLLTINALATLATAVLWRGVGRFTQSWTAEVRAKLLFALRVVPSACALLCVTALMIPAYIAYEPLHTNEVVSAKLAALALLSFAGLSLALWRGLAAWSVTRRLISDWLRHAEPVLIEGVRIPAYKIEHAFPVIAIVGVLRPKLFIARNVCNLLTEEELAAAVAHEAGHLAARDNLKRWLLRACSDVLTIVPCGRALDRAWSESAEAAADESAARMGAQGALNLA
ncbi:MAG: M48 family metalloprotease, partial [Pyrinomonadaceae bacterium]